MAAGAEHSQTTIKFIALPIQTIAEDVEFVLAIKGADFNTRNYFDSEFLANGHRFRDAGGDVVVGNGECTDVGRFCEREHLRRPKTPVRMGCMEMEIDAAHGDSDA